MKDLVQMTVSNLYATAEALEKVANKPQNFNSDFSYYLEQFSWALYKDAKELEDRLYLWGE